MSENVKFVNMIFICLLQGVNVVVINLYVSFMVIFFVYIFRVRKLCLIGIVQSSCFLLVVVEGCLVVVVNWVKQEVQ